MNNKQVSKNAVVDIIKHQIKILNGIVLLIVYALLFLIIRFLYVLLDYVSTPSLVAILSIIAVLVVIGMYLANNASRNAVKTIEEYTRKLRALLSTTRDMREILHGDLLLEKILDSSLLITGADGGSLFLIEGDMLVFKIVRGSKVEKLTGVSIPRSQGIVGWVADNGEVLRIDNVKEDSRFSPQTDNITGYETRSILCAPLKLSSGVIGALEIVNKKNGSFNEDDEELISYFADQAAIAIARARFHEDQKNYEIHLTNILIDTMDSHIYEKRGHSKRVAKYSLLIAQDLSMSEKEKQKLYRACLLHDIGFLKIKLKDVSTKEQYRLHSQLGYEMLKQINFYADIAPIVLHHHERYDGGGYPNALRGEIIPIGSRIIAIAEAFDAMVSKDSYKYIGKKLEDDKIITKPISGFDNAIKELRDNAGTQFDPVLVGIFIKYIDESLVEK